MLRPNFLGRLYLGFFATILVTGGIVGFLQWSFLAERAEKNLDLRLANAAQMLRSMALESMPSSEGLRKLNWRVRELSNATDLRFTVITPDGVVIAESDKDIATMDNHLNRPEIKAVIDTGEISRAIRLSESLGRDMVYRALPIEDSEGLIGVVRVASPQALLEDARAEFVQSILLGVFLAMAVASIIALLIARRVTWSLRSMTNVVGQMVEGDTDVRVQIKGTDEIAQMGRAFNSMADQLADRLDTLTHHHEELRKVETYRQDFVANVSHELKTPLAAIKGLSETILDDEEMPPVMRTKFQTKILKQTDRLTHLVTDLITLSSFDAAGEDVEGSCDLGYVTADVIQTHGHKAQKRNTILQFSQPDQTLKVPGEAEVVRQVVDNLVSNAIKYAPDGSRVCVRVFETEGYAILEVEDTGIGIPAEHQERIFERFYRVDKARSREIGGTGLGLAIVKNVVLRLGGSVALNSEQGKGSTFRVQIPRV